MYKEFFGLQEDPFSLTPDPRFLYMSKRHREALAALVYGIKEQKGFIALTGEIGAGKTTLCRAFLRELKPETSNVALILNSFLNDVELLQSINHEFGLEAASDSKKQLIDALNRFLLEQNEKGKTSILIIDEAQNLEPVVLEQIRMLSNLETEQSKLIQIVLIGQPELNDILAMPELEQLNQRITVRAHISPLSGDEIYHYVRHRLHVAGAKINVSLTPAAVNRLRYFSGGIPRRMNLLCDRALLAAYVAGRFQIDAKMIALAERELRGAGALRARGFRLPGRWAEALLVAIAVLVLTGTLMGVFWLGLRMGFVTGTPGGPATRAAAMAIGNSAVDRLEETTIMPPETPGGATTDQELALPEEEQNSTWYTELKALPVFRPAMVEEDWVWDEDRIARVSDPDLSRVASLLTAAYLWKYDFGMEPLRTAGKEEIRNLNMLRIFRYPGVRLDSFETRDDLQGLMGLDLPLVLRVEDRTGHLSPWVVLLEVRGDRAMLADPRLGRISLGLDTLKRVVQAITVIYHDPDSMIALVRGEESEGVSALHRFLTGEGLWEGDGSGEDFDEELGRSLERFQRAYGLEPSGKLDGFTAATIAAMRTAERPRLSPENLDR